MTYYVMIDSEAYLEHGEVVISGPPISEQDIIEADYQKGDKEPYTYFGVHRTKELYEFINALGGKRGEFISYLLQKKNADNQILQRRIKDLAEEAGVSMQTANDALKFMRANGFIKTNTNILMINPRLDRRGNRRKEARLLNIYETFRCRKARDTEDGEGEDGSQKNHV